MGARERLAELTNRLAALELLLAQRRREFGR
jgi:hypothetical protein